MKTIRAADLAETPQFEDRPEQADALYTARLLGNTAVNLPERRFSGPFITGLVSAFEDFADEFDEKTCAQWEFKRAAISPAFQAVGAKPNRLTFLAAWGKATEFPVPRDYKLKEYFGHQYIRVARRMGNAAIGHYPLLHTPLDAQGFVGYFYKDNEDSVNIRTILGRDKQRRVIMREYKDVQPDTTHLVVDNIFDTIKNASPLDLKARVMHWPRNGHISNDFSLPSDHTLLDKI